MGGLLKKKRKFIKRIRKKKRRIKKKITLPAYKFPESIKRGFRMR